MAKQYKRAKICIGWKSQATYSGPFKSIQCMNLSDAKTTLMNTWGPQLQNLDRTKPSVRFRHPWGTIDGQKLQY